MKKVIYPFLILTLLVICLQACRPKVKAIVKAQVVNTDSIKVKLDLVTAIIAGLICLLPSDLHARHL